MRLRILQAERFHSSLWIPLKEMRQDGGPAEHPHV
jgi:hypothetical protein